MGSSPNDGLTSCVCRCRRRRPCSTRRFATSFLFSTRLDVSSSSSFVVVVFVVVVVTENTPYRGVTVRWARPLTAPFSFYLYCIRVVNIVVVDTRKTSIPWCDRPSGPSPNGGPTSYVCRRRRPVRLDAFDVLFLFSTRLDVSSSSSSSSSCRRRRRLRRRRRQHSKHTIPWCYRPLGPSPNGALASCVFASSYITTWLKAQDGGGPPPILLSKNQVVYLVIVVVVVLFDSTPFDAFSFSTRLDASSSSSSLSVS